jgi:hypothetical protein
MRKSVKAAQHREDLLTDIRSGVGGLFALCEGSYATTVSPKALPVLATSTLTGKYVRNSAGDDSVNIEDFKLDFGSGRIAYALLSKIADEIGR